MSPKLKLGCTIGLSNLTPRVWQWLPLPCYFSFLQEVFSSLFHADKTLTYFNRPGVAGAVL